MPLGFLWACLVTFLFKLEFVQQSTPSKFDLRRVHDRTLLAHVQVREGGLANVRDHFSLSNAAGGLAETLELAVANEPRIAKQLDLGARALRMDSCAH